MYMPNTETLTKKTNEYFKDSNTLSLSRALYLKIMMNASLTLHASLFKHGAVKIINSNERIFVIHYSLLMRRCVHIKLKDGTPIRVTGLPDEIQIAQIKCGYEHVIALDTKGRVYWSGEIPFHSLIE